MRLYKLSLSYANNELSFSKTEISLKSVSPSNFIPAEGPVRRIPKDSLDKPIFLSPLPSDIHLIIYTFEPDKYLEGRTNTSILFHLEEHLSIQNVSIAKMRLGYTKAALKMTQT